MPRGATVAERPRPDYDPIGVRLGGFLLFPDLSVSESYNSNIFATDTNKRDDFITTIEPSLDLRSDWNNHALNFHADAPVVRHADETDENYTDYTLATNGRLDVARDLRLFGAAGYRVRHEERASPDNQGGAEPTEYSVTAASVGVEKTSTGCRCGWTGNTSCISTRMSPPSAAAPSTRAAATASRRK